MTLDQMSFPKMFNDQESDRPFGLIIIALGNYNYDRIKIININRAETPTFRKPTILGFEGVPTRYKFEYDTFRIASACLSTYHGVNTDYMKACDRIFELLNELPPVLQKSAPQLDENMKPKNKRTCLNRSTT